MGDYKPDEFTEADVLRCLERQGLRFKEGHRYILSQCPTHEDVNPSVQIYKDDWFVNCHAGCGRFHITKAYPELRQINGSWGGSGVHAPAEQRIHTKAPKVKYKEFELTDLWKSLPLIPRDHYFKSIPLDTLDALGWRWDEKGQRYFIPYWNRPKTKIPFAQWRNLQGSVRFNFWKDAKPTCYGTWNLEPGQPVFIVEGASDAAVMEYAIMPWIALPSAASGELMKQMAKWAHENGIRLIYAGDNDAAGDKLKEALDEVAPYRVKQARYPYKDWGEMLEAEGIESVINYCNEELFPGQAPVFSAPQTLAKQKTPVEQVLEIFPGSQELEMVGGDKEKEAN